ncbi:HNH endonuclease [Brachybacterium tyrofermentans]|uniref:HNH endonuclease n=1 Tax=Brachybacterium tyrofermentans TaxID=47848 RepID=UPI003FD65D97
MKTCTKCGEEKPLTDYSPDRRRADGRVARCKSCAWTAKKAFRAANRPLVLQQKAEYRARHQERRRREDRERYAENRESILAGRATRPHIHWESDYRIRARKYGFDPIVQAFTPAALVSRYGAACVHCGGPFEELDHHPVPVAHGGPHSLDNCVPSCTPCNRALAPAIARTSARTTNA